MLLREDRASDDSSAFPNPTNPARLNRLIELDAVDTQRHVFCDLYERCLDSAIEEGWPSWTCKSCRRFGIGTRIVMEATPKAIAANAPDHLTKLNATGCQA